MSYDQRLADVERERDQLRAEVGRLAKLLMAHRKDTMAAIEQRDDFARRQMEEQISRKKAEAQLEQYRHLNIRHNGAIIEDTGAIEQACAEKDATIVDLRALLDVAEGALNAACEECSSALNNAFPEDDPNTLDHVHGTLKQALARIAAGRKET